MKKIEILIRKEVPEDHNPIAKINRLAFQTEERPEPTEHILVDRLREEEALDVSLVAEIEGGIVGHIAFTQVLVGGKNVGWFGLGPVAVLPGQQGKGIGAALIEHGLDEIRGLGAQGCMLLGNPAYYGRFGFKADSRMVLEGVPSQYFQVLAFVEPIPEGVVTYHPLFFELG